MTGGDGNQRGGGRRWNSPATRGNGERKLYPPAKEFEVLFLAGHNHERRGRRRQPEKRS